MLQALGCGLAGAQKDGEGVFEVLFGEAFNLFGHGCGEHEELVVVYEAGDDEFDVRNESHIQHFIGFVEDEGPDIRKANRGVVEQVDEPSGGGDEDIDSVAYLCVLDLDGKATINDKGLYICSAGDVGDFRDVLQCEFAGRDEDQGLDGF